MSLCLVLRAFLLLSLLTFAQIKFACRTKSAKHQYCMMITSFLLVVSALVFMSTTSQASRHESYETITRRINDGNKVTSEKIYIKLDSDDSSSKPTIFFDKKITNSLGSHHLKSNDKLWAPKVRPSRMKFRTPIGWPYHKHNLIGGADYEANSLNSIGGHQIFGAMRPRTVESPALSVDTGHGRSSNPSVRLANSIKRLFNVEEGHYTDIYDRIDKHKSLRKKKPAEMIDERLGFSHGH